MIYPYLVVRGGVEYPAGTEVPETDKVETVAKTEQEDKKANVETKTTTTRKKK